MSNPQRPDYVESNAQHGAETADNSDSPRQPEIVITVTAKSKAFRLLSTRELRRRLAVVRYPGFVRYRWEFRSEEGRREKFLGAGSDLPSNAVHRLWWIAELTVDGEDYSTTETVFSNQTMVNKVFDRWFARYQPAVVAICDELADEPSHVIDTTTNRFNHALTTVQLEAFSKKEARELIRRFIAEVEQQVGIPPSEDVVTAT
jgi:hypothetical protein